MTGVQTCALPIWKGHTEGTVALVVGHNNKLYSASDDSTVRVWSMDNGRCLQNLTGHTGWVFGLAVGPDGTAYPASGDKRSEERRVGKEC